MFSSLVSEDRLRSRFDWLSQRAHEKLDFEIVERSDFVLRLGVESFELTIACDIDRGSVTDCTVAYSGTPSRSDLLDLFYITSVAEALGVAVPEILWRRDGKQMKDPIVRMKAVFSAVSAFVRRNRVDSAKLTDRIEAHLEANREASDLSSRRALD